MLVPVSLCLLFADLCSISIVDLLFETVLTGPTKNWEYIDINCALTLRQLRSTCTALLKSLDVTCNCAARRAASSVCSSSASHSLLAGGSEVLCTPDASLDSAAGAGDAANPNEGRGERERAGVEVENPDLGSSTSASRLCCGIER